MPKQHESGCVRFQRVKVYPDISSQDYALGFVTGFGMHTSIEASVVLPNRNFFEVRDGLKHVEDPWIGELDWKQGVWDFYEGDLPRFEDLDELTHPMVRRAVIKLHTKRQQAIKDHHAAIKAAAEAAARAEAEAAALAAAEAEAAKKAGGVLSAAA